MEKKSFKKALPNLVAGFFADGQLKLALHFRLQQMGQLPVVADQNDAPRR